MSSGARREDEAGFRAGAGSAARPWTLGHSLALVYGLVALFVVIGAGSAAWWQAGALAARGEALAAGEVGRLADRAGAVLAEVSRGAAVLAATAPLAEGGAACQSALDAALPAMPPAVRGLQVADAERRETLCAAPPGAEPSLSAASPLFRTAAYSGQPALGALEEAEGPGAGMLLAVGHPARAPGRPAGSALAAVMTVEGLREQTGPPPAGAALWLRDREARVVAFSPEAEGERAPEPGPGRRREGGSLVVQAAVTPEILMLARLPDRRPGAASPAVALPSLLLAAALLTGLAGLFWAARRFVFAPLEAATRRLEAPGGEAGEPGAVESAAPAEIAALIGRLGAARATRDEAIRLRDLLLREAHHRIKNHLTLVSSFLRLQERQLSDPAALAALRAAQGRMVAIGLTYEVLHDGAGEAVALDQMLARFARALAARDLARGRATQVETDTEPVEVPADVAVKVALVVNELATNALKYAFVGRPPGTVTVRLRREGTGFRLTVADDGAGMPEGGRRGLGMTVVDSLLRALGTRLERLPGPGTVFAIAWRPRGGTGVS